MTTASTRPPFPRRPGGFILLTLAALLLFVGAAIAWVAWSVLPKLPSIEAVTDYRPKIPLRIYTADNVLIGQFGVEHRDFVPIAKIPAMMKTAVLAIEDTRFYEHGGIDWRRAAGAARANLGGGFRQGASTITMQVARNFFLTSEKRISRKLTEVALAYKIERALTKDQILELYMNQIYLGQRSYGFSSAARSYFGKTLDQLSLAEVAMLAGLPQNPARHNPVANPKRAQQRQHAILKRLLELGEISELDYRQALAEPLRIKRDAGQSYDTHADYVAELARQAVFERFGEEAYTRGITVMTTIRKAEQDAAYESLRRNVVAYDRRHGYRGPEQRIDLPNDAAERENAIVEALQKRPSSAGLIAAVVISASAQQVRAETLAGDTVVIEGEGLRLVANALSSKARPNQKIAPGAIVRLSRDGQQWTISQIPQVAAAFVAIDANTGEYHALVGGFDYGLQKFNHVTQAWRQPGSAIKPFIYAAALEEGFMPDTRVLDAPLSLPGASADKPWTPQNDDGVFEGEVTLRRALVRSKNVPSIRILRATSVDFTHQYLEHFGFDRPRHPKNFTMALGTGAVTPLQMAGAYAVFANGGYRVKPVLITSIKDGDGSIIVENPVTDVRQEANRAISARNAFVTDSMLRDVTRFGTAAALSKQFTRQDLAGKTGTTNDAIDGWFAGYGANIVGVAWMGYDEPRSLGGREFGSTLAMPIWIDYMKVALARHPEQQRSVPEGLTQRNGEWVYEELVDAPLRLIDIEAEAHDDSELDPLDDMLEHLDGEGAPQPPDDEVPARQDSEAATAPPRREPGTLF